jgi:hypothetical protein
MIRKLSEDHDDTYDCIHACLSVRIIVFRHSNSAYFLHYSPHAYDEAKLFRNYSNAVQNARWEMCGEYQTVYSHKTKSILICNLQRGQWMLIDWLENRVSLVKWQFLEINCCQLDILE